jgi:glycosyltransferase involved in cell wall biosynthesis
MLISEMRILWLKTELLHPVDKGGKIRTYYMLKELKRDHRITYLTLDDGSADTDARERASEYCDELICVPHRTSRKFTAAFYAELALNLLSPLPYFMKKYESAGMRRAIEEQLNSNSFDAVVCDFLQPSLNVPNKLPVATLLFQHNVEAMIWKRHYEVQSNAIKRTYLFDQWRKTRKYEGATCLRFDSVVAVSREDRQLMMEEYGVESISDVPTGVDTDYFSSTGKAGHQPHNLVFTGSMDWLPNEDAMQFFTKDVLPLIREQVPDVTLTVVGRNPYQSLIDLSKKDPSISVTGRVDDVRPYIERGAAYIVPIRIGGGTRLKIYEAMSMSKPVISTTVGAEGLPVHPDVDILFADTPQTFSDAVVRVLMNPEWGRDLGQRARQLVCENLGWAMVSSRFAEICESVVRTPEVERRINSADRIRAVI